MAGARSDAGTSPSDVDTIVLKALQKEPARRYSSAEQLSDDITRYLTGRPVLARKDTVAYRAAKFIRRHTVAVAASALIVMVFLGGAIAIVREARVAERQRQVAEAQRARAERRFNDVRRLATSFLFEFHDAIAHLPGATPARQLVVSKALEYLGSLEVGERGRRVAPPGAGDGLRPCGRRARQSGAGQSWRHGGRPRGVSQSVGDS